MKKLICLLVLVVMVSGCVTPYTKAGRFDFSDYRITEDI